MNNYNIHRYGECSTNRTYSICRQLKKANGDVGVVIKYIGERFKQNLESCNSGQPKAKDHKDLHILYTHENIEKEREVYLASNNINRGNSVYFAHADELYRYSLKIVRDYCESNSSISDHDSFCLYFFLGGLYSHLPGWESFPSSENYGKALDFAGRLQGINSSEITTIGQKRLVKHRAISAPYDNVNFNYYDTSVEDALLLKTYIDRKIYQNFSLDSLEGLSDEKISGKDDLSLCGLNDLPQLFKSIGCTKFSKRVLQLNALDALEHDRFKILFVDEMAKKTSAGTYNRRNTVRVLVESRQREAIRCTLFHELTHKAMDRVFDNASSPYFKNDENAKQAYRASMRQVLLNLIDFAGVGNMDMGKLAFNELIQFCFNEEKLISDHIKEKNEPYMLSLFGRIQLVFSKYQTSELDVEFITNVFQYLILVENNSAYVRCVQPLLDYIDLYVIREIDEYISRHPSRKRMQD